MSDSRKPIGDQLGPVADDNALYTSAQKCLTGHRNPAIACHSFMEAVLAGGGLGAALWRRAPGAMRAECMKFLRVVADDMLGKPRPGPAATPVPAGGAAEGGPKTAVTHAFCASPAAPTLSDEGDQASSDTHETAVSPSAREEEDPVGSANHSKVVPPSRDSTPREDAAVVAARERAADVVLRSIYRDFRTETGVLYAWILPERLPDMIDQAERASWAHGRDAILMRSLHEYCGPMPPPGKPIAELVQEDVFRALVERATVAANAMLTFKPQERLHAD